MSEQYGTHTHETVGMEGTLDAVSKRQEVSGVHDHHEGDGSNDHLASIYESQEDQFEALVPFIQRGLERDERCLYIADDNTTEEILNTLREGGIDVEAARESGALSIYTKADTYLRTGEFEQDAMLDFWQETLAEVCDEEGYTGVRAAAEMTWALDEGTSLDRLVQYEAMLNTIFSGEDYAVLCQYNRERFPADVISDVIRSHPLVVYDSTVCQNFYYHPPDEFFGTDHPSLDVDKTVEGLVSRARTQHALQEREQQLHERLHQQEIVADIGQYGLEERDLDSLLADVTERVAATLDADYCKVLELLPGGEELLLRKGVGWQDGVVGEASVGTDHDSQAGYTLFSERPIIVEDLATESRFSGPDLLVDHDVTSGISVVIGPVDDPWGVLGVHTREQRDFSDHDAAFVQSVANTMATAIERAEHERYQRELYEITSSPDRSFEEKLHALFELGCERFDLDYGGIARIDPESDRFEVERIHGEHDYLVPGEQFPLSETYCQLASEDGETAAVTDPVGAGFEGKLCYEQFGVQSYLGTHLAVDGDDDRTFWFLSNEPRDTPITDQEQTFVDLMGQWIESGLERRQRELELRERKQHLSAIVETTPECIKTLSADGTLLQMNPAGLDMVEADSASDVVGECVYDLIAPEHRQEFREFNEKICRGENGTLEFDIIGQQGTRRHMETHAAPLRSPDGTTSHVAATHDITERKERERYQRVLYEITADTDQSFEEKLQAVFDLGCERFGLELGGIARIDPATDLFEVEVISGDHEHLQPGAQVALSETYCRVIADGAETAGVTDPVDSGFDGAMCYEEFGVNSYLGAHIEVDGDLDRTFFFVSSESRDEEFSEAEHTFHRLMSQWVSYELERKQREDNLAALNALTRDLMHEETVTDVSESVIEAADEALELPVAAIALYDDRQGILESVAETDPAATLLRETSLLDVGAGTAWEAFVKDTQRRESDPLGESDATLHPTVTEVAIFPLGKHGVFLAGSTATEGFSSTAFDFVETVVANTRSAFERADREQQVHEREEVLEEQNETLERLNRINDIIRNIDQALVDASTRSEIETVVCEQLADVGPYEFAWIGEHDAVTDEVIPREWAGNEKGYLDETAVTADDSPAGKGPSGRAIRTREPQVVNNVLDDPPYEPWRQAALNRGYHATVALPLVYEGSLYSVLNVYAREPGVFDDLERSVLAELSDTIAYAINAVESKKALVSDTVTELKFDIHGTEIETVELSSELDCTITLGSVIPQADGRLRIFFSTHDVLPATFVDAASRMPIQDLSLLSEHEKDGDPVGLYEGLLTDESIYGTILKHGGVPQEIAIGNEEAYVTVELAADAATREFVATIRTNFPGAELVAQRAHERAHQSPTEIYASLTNSLTDRQLEVLQTAFFSGYFEKPRTRTGSEIASSLDITQPTFNHHVRAAQRKFFDSLFEEDGSLGVTSYDTD